MSQTTLGPESGRPLLATLQPKHLERFTRSTKYDSQTECWIWQAFRHRGYGRLRIGVRQAAAHRVAWTWFYQRDIPAGMTLDHLCRNPSCVNPMHLEPVTVKTNTRRSPIALAAINVAKTHCPAGHSLTPENLLKNERGYRRCRICHAEKERQRRKSKPKPTKTKDQEMSQTTTQRLINAARQDEKAQAEAQRIRQRLRDATCASVESGMSEYEAADLAGVSRITVREWLGKGKKK